ncbi:MAG: class II fructose-bisphosphate aldolase [Candidatus Zambryskibacteria bacterium]|nr:class II fructose-bisphosphate aldolase [Candidatus Zambryskibacteria bacterium]
MKSLREWLSWTEEKRVAIGHFNISDSEGFKAVVEAAKGLQVPVIIGVSEGEREFIGLEEIVALVKIARGNGLPVFINADHTYSVEKAKAAIDAGVDSVIIDAAEKSFEENVRMTKEIVAYARLKNPEILVEGELGFIGKSSKVLDTIPDGVSEETQTKPEDAKKFVEQTGIDLLAPSVGNVHGIVKTGEPKLNIERIRAIRQAVGIPLVLHGGSGNKDDEFINAIDAGVRIIHINTELRLAYKEGLAEAVKSGEVAPYKFMQEAVEDMKKVVISKLRVFNGELTQ